MVRVFLLLLIFGIGTSCSINNSKSDVLDEVRDARKVWNSTNSQNYSYHFQTLCFCFFTEEVRVVVREDSVVDVQHIDTNETYMVDGGGEFPVAVPIHEYLKSSFFTINQYFDQLEVQVPVADESNTKFDRLTGMPVEIYFDYIEEASDDEITYLFSNLIID